LSKKKADLILRPASILANDRGRDMEAILIVLLVVFLLGGGGWGYSRWRRN
jgi:hypothetical protein